MTFINKTPAAIVQYVRKYYNVTEDDIKRDVEIVKNWMKQQPHLPQDIQDDEFLEKSLLRNKFQVEKTKQKLEMYYTNKAVNRDMFEDCEDLIPSKQCFVYFPLDGYTEVGQRVFLFKMIDYDAAKFDFYTLVRCVVLYIELFSLYNYSVEDVYIIDCQGITFSHYTKMNPLDLQKLLKFFLPACSGKIRSVHFINYQPFFKLFFALLKPLMSAKLFQRNILEDNIENIYKVVPMKCLPSDYGGEQKSVADHIALYDQFFIEHRPMFRKLAGQFSDETKRIGATQNDKMFGTDGTFKKINLD